MVKQLFIAIISQSVGGSKKPPGRYYSYHSVITIISPCPETFKVVVLTPIYSYVLTTKYVCTHKHTNTYFHNKQFSTSEQALWEINKLYPIHSYAILVINTQVGLM